MSTTYSFGPSSRIKKRSDFLKIQSSGHKYRSKHFLLIISKNNSNTRVGITVTTKVDKRATKRNRLRRRIREIFRLKQPRITKGIDLVIICLTGSTELNFDHVEKEIYFLFKKAKVI